MLVFFAGISHSSFGQPEQHGMAEPETDQCVHICTNYNVHKVQQVQQVQGLRMSRIASAAATFSSLKPTTGLTQTKCSFNCIESLSIISSNTAQLCMLASTCSSSHVL